jgi:hypothetical protein
LPHLRLCEDLADANRVAHHPTGDLPVAPAEIHRVLLVGARDQADDAFALDVVCSGLAWL